MCVSSSLVKIIFPVDIRRNNDADVSYLNERMMKMHLHK